MDYLTWQALLLGTQYSWARASSNTRSNTSGNSGKMYSTAKIDSKKGSECIITVDNPDQIVDAMAVLAFY